MRCFGPVYLDLFFFWLSLYSYPTSLFILFICKTVFLAITPQPKQGCVLLGVLPATFDEALHITFVFYSTPWLCWWDWHGYWSVLKGSERGRGGDSVWVCVCMCVCIYVFVCQICPLEPVVHRELPLTNYICQSSRPMPIDARGGNKKIVAEVYKSVKSCLGHVGLLEILAVTQ